MTARQQAFGLNVGTLLLTVLIAPLAWTQTAQIGGLISDPTQAAITKAKILVMDEATGVQRTTESDERGLYLVPLLRPGHYRVAVQAPGFGTLVRPNIKLDVGEEVRLDFVLRVGAAEKYITVTGGAPMVNTENAAVGTVVDRQFVENLPLNGRSFQSLLMLAPGVVSSQGVGVQGGGQNVGNFSVNGMRGDSNSFTVDGVSANLGTGNQSSGTSPGLTGAGTTQTMASVDALQELRVQTSNYSAEFGRQSGGQVSIVTRSGTNQYHGGVFEYFRNTIFEANNWFSNANSLPKAPLQQNDFGGTFGGPVWLPGYKGKDKTFFFLSYEGLRLRLPQFATSSVPSACLRGTGPCAAGQAPANALLQPELKAFPLPNGADLLCPAGNSACPVGTPNGLAVFKTTYSNPTTIDAFSARFDHNINSAWNIFGRYNRPPSSSGIRNSMNYAANAVGLQSMVGITIGLTGKLNSNLVNDFRYNYSDIVNASQVHVDSLGGAVFTPSSTFLPREYTNSGTQAAIIMAIPGTPEGTIAWVEQEDGSGGTQTQHNIVDTFSYHLGSHQLKFGGDYRRLTPTTTTVPMISRAIFQNQSQLRTGIAPQFQVFNRYAQSLPVYINYSAFVEDSWRVSRRLTLDLGLRWDVNPAPGSQNGIIPYALDQITNLATTSLDPVGTEDWNTRYFNFGPRLGAAYQLFGGAGHETVLRGGFGVFFDSGNNLGSEGFQTTYFPFSLTRILANVAFPLTATAVAPLPLPNLQNPPIRYGNLWVFDPNLELPYTKQWNVAVQQALGSNQALTLSYVGNSGNKLLKPTALNLTAINPKFSSMILTTNGSTSSYHALQAQFQRRMSHGLQGTLSYTWSHAIDDTSTDFSDGGGSTAAPPINASSSFDLRHVVGGALTYDIPTGTTNPVANAIIGHWSVSSGYHMQTAYPVDIVQTSVTDPLTGLRSVVYPNVNAGVPRYLYGDACAASRAGAKKGQPCPGGFRANPAAFTNITSAQITAGQRGTVQRNSLRGWGTWQADTALQRQFKITEALNLLFRAEAFNLFNHANFGRMDNNTSSATFGEAQNTLNVGLNGMAALYQIGGPRSFQFAMKVQF